MNSTDQDQERVFPCTLTHLFATEANASPTEQEVWKKRKELVQSLLRYCVNEIGKINVLTNLFVTMHMNYLIQRSVETALSENPEPVPACVQTEIYFRNAMMFVTTEDGKFKPPLFKNSKTEKGDERRAEKMSKEKLEAYNRKRQREQAEKTRLQTSFNHVFTKEFLPLLPPDFQFPRRDHLAIMLEYQNAKRVTNLKTYYQTTLLTKQNKVISDSVDRNLASAFPNQSHKERQPLFRVCRSFILAQINNWTYNSHILAKDPVAAFVVQQQMQSWGNQLVGEHREYNRSPWRSSGSPSMLCKR